MNTKDAVFYIDSAGADFGETNTWAEVGLVTDSEDTAEREVVQEKCRGEDVIVESPSYLSISGTVTMKFRRGSALLNTVKQAVLDGTPLACWNCTGDNTVSGNEGWQMGALFKQLGRPMGDGEYLKYTFSYAPHEQTESPAEFVTVA